MREALKDFSIRLNTVLRLYKLGKDNIPLVRTEDPDTVFEDLEARFDTVL